jgi:ankyrin repeat protein
MQDLQQSGIFNDVDVIDDDVSWDIIERKSDIWFNEKLKPLEKLKAIRNINILFQSRNEYIRTQNLLMTEERIQNKIKEMQAKGLVESDNNEEELLSYNSITRYGRSPLHEAISARNLRFVKKCIRKGLYLDCIDNNGHTPMEMAYYENYKEVMMLFKAHRNKK